MTAPDHRAIVFVASFITSATNGRGQICYLIVLECDTVLSSLMV